MIDFVIEFFLNLPLIYLRDVSLNFGYPQGDTDVGCILRG